MICLVFYTICAIALFSTKVHRILCNANFACDVVHSSGQTDSFFFFLWEVLWIGSVGE